MLNLASSSSEDGMETVLSCRPTLYYVNTFKERDYTGWFTYDIAAAGLSAVSLLLVSSLILLDNRL
jgi:hypothetical protein